MHSRSSEEHPRHAAAAAADSRTRKNWEKAYDQIKHSILTMGIRPGEPLSENSLAKKLGISRTPVREALNALEREGLVVSSRGRKKAFVLTTHDVQEIFDLKIAVEGKIARWAAERANQVQRSSLEKVTGRMVALSRRSPPNGPQRDEWHGRWIGLDEEYHSLLFRMAANRRAEHCIRVLNSLWHRLRLGMIAIEGRIGRSSGEHERIARAVIAGKPAEAEKLMEEHLRRLKEMLLGIMEAFHYPTVDTRGRGARSEEE